MSFQFLCTGDIHLGRRPTRIPKELDAGSLGPAAAWRAFVDEAIARKVDAVALTGDVVDESNRFYEAFSVLQSGVERLVAAGIPVVAVSGNHDFDVLPSLADQFPSFHLLGRGGQWQHVTLEQGGAAAVVVQGWSFPAGHVSTDPLAGYAPPPDGLPLVGLLHCDCDAAASPWAPVASSALKAHPPAVWLLGHIHQARVLCDARPLILYPGSPVGLDPAERGSHGAWLVTIIPGQDAIAEPVPLGLLRWEEIDLSLAGISDEASFGPAVVQALRTRHQEIREQLTRTRAVGCRLRLSGRSAIHHRLPDLLPTAQGDLRPTFEGVMYFLEKVEDNSQPDISLEDIARSPDPAGLLASRLLTLERRDPAEAYREMIDQAAAAIVAQRGQPVFALLPDSHEPPDVEAVRDLLLRAGMDVLEGLLSQKEARS